VFNRSYANVGDMEQRQVEYATNPDFDPVTRWAFKFRDGASYGQITYGKSATLLTTLEGLIGRDTMDEAMRTYFLRYRFTHPTTEDFLRTIEEVAIKNGRATAVGGTVINTSTQTAQPNSSQLIPDKSLAALFNAPSTSQVVPISSLRPFFNQAVYGTQVLDYTVDQVSSDPVQWWLPEPKDKKQIQYLSTVYLRRKGDFILPVTAEIIFDDGTRLREHWDGVDRWTKFTYTRNAKIVSVEVDPDHVVLLDKDFFNNSYLTTPNNVPARKLSNIWLSLQQLLAQLSSWIV